MKKIPWNKIIWTKDEIGFLAVYNDKYTIKEMSKILGKSVRSIKRMCYDELGLFKSNEAKYNHRSNADKKRGTDLSYEYVKNEAAKYNSRIEFMQKSPNAYRKANIMGWANDICSHMVSKMFSLPQLMLKSYLEQIFEEKCSYNDREALKPYEIDCYFPKYKVGWEYNGIRFHKNNKNDSIKSEMAIANNIKLFYINEENKVVNYENFIKKVLKEQIKDINKILGRKKINNEFIDNMACNIEYPNLLTKEERIIAENNKIKEIGKINKKLYDKIIHYNLFKKYNIEDDRRKMHYFDTFEEYFDYIKKQNYTSFTDACNKQHIYRMCKKFEKNINIFKKYYEN